MIFGADWVDSPRPPQIAQLAQSSGAECDAPRTRTPRAQTEPGQNAPAAQFMGAQAA